MEVHKPKPIHGWKDFLKEIGSIVLGVSIALAAEQGVEWWHWQHELRETREALHAELARAVGSYQYDAVVQDCSERRLGELSQWLDHSQPGERLVMVRPIGVPMGYSFLFGAWEVAKSGQAAWRMPLDEKLRFAHLYGALARFDEITRANNEAWRQMAQFTSAEPLDHADRMALRGLVARARVFTRTLRTYGPFVLPDVAALGIAAEKRPPIDTDLEQSFCAPLFAR